MYRKNLCNFLCQEGTATKQSLQQLKSHYVNCQTEENECDIDGKKYAVIRHFSEKKLLAREIFRLALNRADRDSGLNK